MKYRSEIDGLRAIAVLPVILFHAGFDFFSGGYIGVDVFFVISGYLITGIIINEMDDGNFSLLNFYERRARRILPSLFFVILCCIPVAWFLFLPSDMKDFAQSLVAVSTFSSNILFWRESGYFDTSAEFKPLLHTWSLAVEEQFYILFPLFLMVAWRFGKRFVVWTLISSFLISLAMAHWGAYIKPAATFFLLPTRAWELLTGSFAAFYLQRKRLNTPFWLNNLLSAVGFLAILYAVIAFDETTPFPSLYALAPTTGTVLVIMFARKGTWTYSLLTLRSVVAVGLISYSLYLWHQPVFAFWRHYYIFEPTHIQTALLLLLCLLLALFSYKFIEQPFRKPSALRNQKRVFLRAALTGSLIFTFGASGHLNNGFPIRLTSDDLFFSETMAPNSLRQTCEEEGVPCLIFGDYNEQSTHIFVIGDSHSTALLPAFFALSDHSLAHISHSGLGGCPPLLDTFIVDGNYEVGACNGLSQTQIQYAMENNVDVVFLVARWSLYVDEESYGKPKQGYWLTTDDMSEATLETSRTVFESQLAHTVRRWLSLGIDVFIVPQVPQQEYVPSQVLAQAIRLRDYSKLSEYDVSRSNHNMLQQFSNRRIYEMEKFGAQIVDFTDFLCDDASCSMFDIGGSLYSDYDHLSERGALGLSLPILEIFE